MLSIAAGKQYDHQDNAAIIICARHAVQLAGGALGFAAFVAALLLRPPRHGW
jgi:hypothetical protein